MPELADIFRLYGPAYLERFGPAMLPSHRRALQDIVDCRTPVLGGQLYQCNSCGREHYVYHSCRNRSCPKCHTADTAAWIEQRRQEPPLPVGGLAGHERILHRGDVALVLHGQGRHDHVAVGNDLVGRSDHRPKLS